jgi:hypothetical protein
MKKVILFGASKMGEIAYTINKGNFIIEAFCDNDKKKWGKSFLGVPVISPDQLSLKEKIDDIHIIVTSIYKKEIIEQLKKLGITNVYCFNYEQYIEKVYPAKSEKEFSTQILLTDVGVKTTNQLLNINNFIHDNLPCFSLPISKLKLGIDGLSDEFTNAYKSIKESPHLELINALLNNKEILKTNYIYRLENGTLDLRNKMLITNEFIKFTKDTFNKRINEFELGKVSPIRVARVKDEWLVIDGKHRAALGYALGYQDIKVFDSSYIYSDSFLLWIYFLMNEHKNIFKKNLLIYKNLFEFKKGE